MTINRDTAILEQAKSVAAGCQTITELAEKMDMPRTTLHYALRRKGVTFQDLVTEADATTIATTNWKAQVEHWKTLAERRGKQLASREWLRDELAACAVRQSPVNVPAPKLDTPMKPQVAVLEYSDPHFGLLVPPGQLGVFGEYNSEMAANRTKHTFQTFTRLVKQQRFPVNEVKIYLLGDMVENSHMRPAQARQTDAHVIQQTIQASAVLASCLRMLCGEFAQVTVEAVPGNHGRTTEKAGDNEPDETFDNLVYYIIQKSLAAQPNFKLTAHRAWYFLDNICGWKFLGLHCEDVLSFSNLPWYGIERLVKDYYLMLGQVTTAGLRELDPTLELTVGAFLEKLLLPDYVTIGHFHNPMVWQLMGVECIANGSLSGVSLYSTKRLHRLTPPRQQMFFVHPEQGVGLRCPIKLDHIK